MGRRKRPCSCPRPPAMRLQLRLPSSGMPCQRPQAPMHALRRLDEARGHRVGCARDPQDLLLLLSSGARVRAQAGVHQQEGMWAPADLLAGQPQTYGRLAAEAMHLSRGSAGLMGARGAPWAQDRRTSRV